tara:strand:+ start:28956 stop:29858 length:903 start_codon:yes stop_codon:yes gene_type:complete
MACNNCNNGCVNPQSCACDCTTCAEANSCDIPVGDTGPQGPQGPQGPPGVNGTDGINGADGTDGCTLMDVYISDGTDGNVQGDVIVTTGPTPTPCNQVINAGNIIQSVIQQGALLPSGIIVMWSGPLGSIPLGWTLCDGGAPGVPNLSGKFIASYGAGDPNFGAILAAGGSTTVSLSKSNIPAHVHNIGSYTALMATSGAHAHRWRGFFEVDGSPGWGSVDRPQSRNRIGGDPLEWTTARPFDGTNDCTGDTDTNCGAHSHNVTLIGNSGDGTADSLNFPQGVPFNILPQFVTLAYIIKD